MQLKLFPWLDIYLFMFVRKRYLLFEIETSSVFKTVLCLPHSHEEFRPSLADNKVFGKRDPKAHDASCPGRPQTSFRGLHCQEEQLEE